MLRQVILEFRKYGAIARINLQNNLAYAGELVWRSLFMVVVLYVLVQLWRAAYSGAAAGAVSGMTLSETLWYLVMTETIMLSRPGFAGKVSEEVKDGSLAYTIGRPYNYLLYHYACGFGDTLMRLVVNFAVGSLLVAAVVGPLSFRLPYLLPLLVVIALALLLDFCIEGLIGLCAFVTEDVSSIQLIYGKTLFILGGLLIPLDFFPQWLREIAQGLPFHYVIYAPARLFVSFHMGQWRHVVWMQAAWVSVFALALWVFWKRASRHLAINGG